LCIATDREMPPLLPMQQTEPELISRQEEWLRTKQPEVWRSYEEWVRQQAPIISRRSLIAYRCPACMNQEGTWGYRTDVKSKALCTETMDIVQLRQQLQLKDQEIDRLQRELDEERARNEVLEIGIRDARELSHEEAHRKLREKEKECEVLERDLELKKIENEDQRLRAAEQFEDLLKQDNEIIHLKRELEEMAKRNRSPQEREKALPHANWEGECVASLCGCKWGTSEVSRWLQRLGIAPRVIEQLANEGVTGRDLLLLSKAALTRMGVASHTIRERVLSAVSALRAACGVVEAEPQAPAQPPEEEEYEEVTIEDIDTGDGRWVWDNGVAVWRWKFDTDISFQTAKAVVDGGPGIDKGCHCHAEPHDLSYPSPRSVRAPPAEGRVFTSFSDERQVSTAYKTIPPQGDGRVLRRTVIRRHRKRDGKVLSERVLTDNEVQAAQPQFDSEVQAVPGTPAGGQGWQHAIDVSGRLW